MKRTNNHHWKNSTTAYERDPVPSKILDAVRAGDRRLPPDLAQLKIQLAECSEQDGRLYVQGRLFVLTTTPLRLWLLRSCHDNVAAGHPGRAKTYELLSRNYFWPNMNQRVRRYVRNCYTCSRSRASRLQYQGLLQPLEAPTKRWEDIAVDFIIDLPKSRSETTDQICRNIMVVTDRLSKQRHFIGCGSTEAKYTARLFLHQVWKHHGLPRNHRLRPRDAVYVKIMATNMSKTWKPQCLSHEPAPRSGDGPAARPATNFTATCNHGTRQSW